MKRVLAFVLAMSVAVPGAAWAQVAADAWRSFAEKVEVGTELNVRLSNGQRFRAVLIGTQPDAILLQPKTRVTVPVQAVPYESIVLLERRQGGIGAAKAAAIGVASGVGAFFAIMLILVATID